MTSFINGVVPDRILSQLISLTPSTGGEPQVQCSVRTGKRNRRAPSSPVGVLLSLSNYISSINYFYSGSFQLYCKKIGKVRHVLEWRHVRLKDRNCKTCLEKEIPIFY